MLHYPPMELQSTFLDLALGITDFMPLVAFLAPTFGGEIAVLVLAFFAAQGHYELWVVIFWSFLGMLAIDSFWFFLVRSPWAERVKQWKQIGDAHEQLRAWSARFSERSDVVILLVSKMLLGTRILIIAYISMRNLSYARFMLFNGIATFIWAVMLGYAGWFAGRGYYALASTYDLITGVAFAVTGLLVFYGALMLLRRWLTRK